MATGSQSHLRRRLGWFGGIVGFAAGVVALMVWLTGALHQKVGPPVGSTAAAKESARREARPVPAGARTASVTLLAIPLVETASGTIESAYRSEVAAKLLAKVIEVRVVAGQRVAKDEPIALLDDVDLKARVGQADASVAQAKAGLDQSRIEATRIEEALRGGAATSIEADRARNRVREAEAALDRASRGLEEANAVLDHSVIRSPLAGVVVDKHVQAGDTVTPGQSVATIYDPERMQLVASIRESLALGLKVGRSITVQVDALGRECSGTVSEIVPQAEAGSRSFQVKVTGPCPEGVYAGMFGRLILPLGEEVVLVVPSAAVRRVGQIDLVDCIEPAGDGERLATRSVRLGRTLGENVEVLSGLREGERVLLPAEEVDHG